MALALALPSGFAATDDPDTTDATSYVTPLVTPAGSAGIVVCVLNAKGSAPDLASLSSPTWLSGAWTQEADISHASVFMRMTVFSGRTIASPAADTITATFGAAQTGCIISVVECTDEDETDFLLQPKAAAPVGTGTTHTITLDGALAAATSIVLGFHAINSNSVITPGDVETEIQDAGHGTPARRLQTQHKLNDTSSTVTYATSSRLGIVVEIKEAVGVVFVPRHPAHDHGSVTIF